MKRLIIVSNRLPVKIISNEQGGFTLTPSTGGLATGMKSVYKNFESLWFGWSGWNQDELNQKQAETIAKHLKKEQCVPVPLTSEQVEKYYYGFSNKTLWPLFHYFTQYAQYDQPLWESYVEVNRIFANELKMTLKEGDKIWIHDYHLFLLPQMIRDFMPSADIGFFLHIPFPSYEVFRLLPWREEILRGMLGADLIGFHTYDYERHFMSSVRRQLGYENTYNRIRLKDRVMKVDAFPMGIHFDSFYSAAEKVHNKRISEKTNDSELAKNLKAFFAGKGEKKLILSMDRLDYSKGIYNRLLAFEKFLESSPEQMEKVSMFMLAVPSRTSVDHYQMLKSEIDETVGRINSRYGTLGWMPIWYLFRAMPFEQLIELYYYSHIALITPIRDGMNLIAKEYMACRVNGDGVLILSEMAGAAKEMGEVSIVNPNDLYQIAQAIRDAIYMPVHEQIKRNTPVIKRLKRYNVEHWANDFMKVWQEVKSMQEAKRTWEVNAHITDQISQSFVGARDRLLMLDYDGTLVPFYEDPDDAVPEEHIRQLIEKISNIPNTRVYIISGRNKDFLERIFENTGTGLVAEHGVWIRNSGHKWDKVQEYSNAWKKEISDILQIYADRTPGSFIEEKHHSLTWHYRRADPDLGNKRAWELNDELRDLCSNLNLEVLEGKKVLEVKQMGINKGTAAQRLMKHYKSQFVLAVGDDWTDEYMFRAIGHNGVTVKVGLEHSDADYYLDTSEKVPDFLKKIVRQG